MCMHLCTRVLADILMLFGALKAFGNRWIGMLLSLETSLPESDLLINDIGHGMVLYVIKHAPHLMNHIPPATVLLLSQKLPHWTMPVNPIFLLRSLILSPSILSAHKGFRFLYSFLLLFSVDLRHWKEISNSLAEPVKCVTPHCG